MSIKSLLALADDKLHEVFARKPYDPTKARKAMIKRVDTARNQHLSATPTKGKKIFVVKNGVAQVTLPFSIGGKNTFHVPSERLVEFFDHLKASITGGELDKELEDTHPGRTSTAPAVTRKRREMSPEAKATMVAKRKATLEAKAKK